jgi:hypothetical protein
MLLDLADGRAELCHRAERSTHAWHLRLGRALTHRPAHESNDEHPTKETDEHPPPHVMLVHIALLSLAVASLVSHDQCHGSPDLCAFHKLCSILGLVYEQSKIFSKRLQSILPFGIAYTWFVILILCIEMKLEAERQPTPAQAQQAVQERLEAANMSRKRETSARQGEYRCRVSQKGEMMVAFRLCYDRWYPLSN